MKVQYTAWWHIIVAIIIGGTFGVSVASLVERSAFSMLGAPWFVDVVLVCLGVVVLVLSWQVKQYVDGKRPYIDANRAVITLVLAKALTLGASMLVGWYAGQLLICIPHWEIEYFHEVGIQCAIAAVVCVLDIIAGYVGQHWCTLPPNKGPEHPQIKAQRRMMRSAVTEMQQREQKTI